MEDTTADCECIIIWINKTINSFCNAELVPFLDKFVKMNSEILCNVIKFCDSPMLNVQYKARYYIFTILKIISLS